MALVSSNSLWDVIRNVPTVDPQDLLTAVELECAEPEHDTRTRILIRDSLRALAQYWGEAKLNARLVPSIRAFRAELESVDMGDRGFSILARCIMDRTTAEDVGLFLHELGKLTREPTRLMVGGSTSLILRDLLRRQTDDLDVVDEIPSSLRHQHQALEHLVVRFKLRLAHFQSHYLPHGWQDRITLYGTFGMLSVSLVDPIDLFIGKMFSRRTKDFDDCRMLVRELDQDSIVDRVKYTTRPLRADEPSLKAAESTWELLFRQPLPPDESA